MALFKDKTLHLCEYRQRMKQKRFKKGLKFFHANTFAADSQQLLSNVLLILEK
jgi:hypothetical protein